MPGLPTSSTIRFLFRNDRGRIDRRTWWHAIAVLVAAWLVALAVQRFLNRSGDITKVAITAAFVVATIFVAVCYYFVSAKRFNDRGKPAEYALLLPVAIFFAAAVRWLGPALVELIPSWFDYFAGGLALAVAIWNVVELGILPGRDEIR
jgi:uncharacterized membrane protein YhaH (DUF805 family)